MRGLAAGHDAVGDAAAGDQRPAATLLGVPVTVGARIAVGEREPGEKTGGHEDTPRGICAQTAGGGVRRALDDRDRRAIHALHGDVIGNAHAVAHRGGAVWSAAGGIDAVADEHRIASVSGIHGVLDRVGGRSPIRVRPRGSRAVQPDIMRWRTGTGVGVARDGHGVAGGRANDVRAHHGDRIGAGSQSDSGDGPRGRAGQGATNRGGGVGPDQRAHHPGIDRARNRVVGRGVGNRGVGRGDVHRRRTGILIGSHIRVGVQHARQAREIRGGAHPGLIGAGVDARRAGLQTVVAASHEQRGGNDVAGPGYQRRRAAIAEDAACARRVVAGGAGCGIVLEDRVEIRAALPDIHAAAAAGTGVADDGAVFKQAAGVHERAAAAAGRRILRKQAASRQATAVQIGAAAAVTGGAVVAHDAARGRTADVEIEAAALTVRPAVLHGALLKRSGADELDTAAVRG